MRYRRKRRNFRVSNKLHSGVLNIRAPSPLCKTVAFIIGSVHQGWVNGWGAKMQTMAKWQFLDYKLDQDECVKNVLEFAKLQYTQCILNKVVVICSDAVQNDYYVAGAKPADFDVTKPHQPPGMMLDKSTNAMLYLYCNQNLPDSTYDDELVRRWNVKKRKVKKFYIYPKCSKSISIASILSSLSSYTVETLCEAMGSTSASIAKELRYCSDDYGFVHHDNKYICHYSSMAFTFTIKLYFTFSSRRAQNYI